MRKTILKPELFIICGQVGAGKTTTAKLLSKIVGAPVVSVDSTLKKLLPNPSFVNKDKPPTMDELAICYNAFALLTDYTLVAGGSIIIDGAFSKQKQRDLIIQIAKKHGVPYHVLYIYCPDKILRARVSKRFLQGKGVGWIAHLKIKKIYEPVNFPHFTIDTSKSVPPQLRKFLKRIDTKH